jgi:ribonuclease HI
MNIHLYCDGGCRGNGQSNNIGAWAVVLCFGKYHKEFFHSEMNTTNNRMELTALINGLSELKRYDIPVIVFCDSSYVIHNINTGSLDHWLNNGWRTSNKKPVKNRDLWIQVKKLIVRFKDISVQRVPGHAGIR